MTLMFALWSACTLDLPPVPEPAPAPTPTASAPQPVAAVAPDPLAAMRRNPLRITRHGQCRMACRQFDRAEVLDVLANGTWQPERTRDDGPCPSHALEGTTSDGQQARMVFAACRGETKLVTAIDLDEEHHCACD